MRAPLRPETRQRLLSLFWRALRRWLGPAARPVARLWPALEAEADYQRWIETREAVVEPVSERTAPLVSLLLPVFDAPEGPLAAALDSVLAQTYGRFEVCAADGGPPGSAGSRTLSRYAARDARIRIAALGSNRGIAGNSNAALGQARGEFVASLDQDDLLEPDALAATVGHLTRDPGLDLVYSDKDNVTPWGDRYAAFLKPGWSPELLLSSNYLAHLALVRRSLIDAAGGFDESADGAQDWDLFLRLAEHTDRIAHVPRVLYHWRALPTSCASSLDAKPYAREAQRRAVQAALDRRGIAGRVTNDAAGILRIVPALERPPRLSVVLLGSAREVPGAAAHGDVEIVATPVEARGDLVLFWDTRQRPVSPEWLRELAFWATQDGVGAVGPVVRRRDGRVAHAGFAASEGRWLPLFAGCRPDRWTPLGRAGWYRNVLALGTTLMTRRDVLERVGIPETTPEAVFAFAPRAHEAGLRNVVVPSAVLAGEAPATPGPLRREPDPYFNPNLDPASGRPRPRPR